MSEYKERGFNGCLNQARRALIFLSKNDRPGYGESQYNAEHLYQIAKEIGITQDRLADENAKLRQRVEELEKENSKLKRDYLDFSSHHNQFCTCHTIL